MRNERSLNGFCLVGLGSVGCNVMSSNGCRCQESCVLIESCETPVTEVEEALMKTKVGTKRCWEQLVLVPTEVIQTIIIASQPRAELLLKYGTNTVTDVKQKINKNTLAH